MDTKLTLFGQTDSQFRVIHMPPDGSCLFHCAGNICYSVYGNNFYSDQVREEIVNYVSTNWAKFQILTHDVKEDNYISPEHYRREMLKPSTCGSACELIAASELFHCIFRVYHDGHLLQSFGVEGTSSDRINSNGAKPAGLAVLEMVDIDLNSVPSINLKIIFGVHFILITWGIQGHWSPDSYFFYNLVFILTLLWGIHSKDKAEPIQIAVVIDAVSVLLDIISVAVFWDAGEKFSVAMALLNLALRPISVVMLGRVCADRMGLDDGFPARFGNLFGDREDRGPYEDIERGSGPTRQHQNVPNTETADFTPTYH